MVELSGFPPREADNSFPFRRFLLIVKEMHAIRPARAQGDRHR